MADIKLCADSSMTVLLPNDKFPCSSHQALDSFWIPSPSSALRGSNSLSSFENGSVGDADEDLYEGYLQPQAKKRRLTASQVRVLEKHFEVENKLEPERKVQLAKELGLEPRQVAIWFQNRRARFKNKQLERDCDSMRASYDKLKADFDCLLKENENLKNQVLSLKEKLLAQENMKGNLERPDASKSSEKESEFHVANAACEKIQQIGQIMDVKYEDASSARSDVFDSESPQYGSSFVSEFSQEEEQDGLQKSLLDTPCFTKLEDDEYSCNLGLSLEDQPIWSWIVD